MPLCDKGWRALVSITKLSQPPSITNAPHHSPSKSLKSGWGKQTKGWGPIPRFFTFSLGSEKAWTKSAQGHDKRACSHCCNCAGHLNVRHYSQIEQDAELIQTSSRLPLEYTHSDVHTCTQRRTHRSTTSLTNTSACLNACVQGCARGRDRARTAA